MDKDKTNYLGFSFLLFGGLLYSFYGVFSRIIGTSIPQFFQIWTRAIIILVFIFLAILITKTKLKRIEKGDWGWGLSMAITAGLLLPFFFIAVNNLAIGTTLFAFYATSTVASFLLGKIIFKEKLIQIKIISLSLAISGLLFLYWDNMRTGELQYLLLAGLSGALYGLNISSIKKINNAYSAFQVNLFNWFGALAINLIVSFFLAEHWNFSFSSIPWIANIGLSLCSFGASFFVIYGFKFIEMQKGSIILLSELIFAVLLGLFFYREIPSISTIIASLLIFFALVLPNLKVSNKNV